MKNRAPRNAQYAVLPLFLAASLVMGCAKNTSLNGSSSGSLGPSDSVTALAAAVASGAVVSASGGNLGYLAPRSRSPISLPLDLIRELAGPELSAWAAGACPTYANPAGTSCVNNAITLSYPGCSFGSSSAMWIGGETLTFGGSAACGKTQLPLINAGDTLTRTFSGSIAQGNPTTRTGADGFLVQLDSQTSTGYSSGVSGGYLVTGTGTGQTIDVKGVNVVIPGKLDVTVSSVSGALLTVSPGQSATIQSGILLVQHNTLKYSGTSVFSDVAYNGSSCFPQSGRITTTLSGAVSGTETLTFTGGGTATLTTPTGGSLGFTMQHCF